MSRTRTLAQLQSDLQYLADAQNLTVRHDATNQTRVINQAIQRFREKLSNEGINHFLVPYSTTLGVGATSPHPFYSLDLTAISPGIVRVYMVIVTRGNRQYKLEGVEFTEITRYQDAFRGLTPGVPLAFANQQTAKLAIMPPPDTAYPVVVWYLPVQTDLAAAGDTFDGVAGWEDWVVYQAAIQLANRDRDSNQIAALGSERDRVWAEVIRSAGRVNRASTIRRRDTWAERITNALYAKWRLP